MVGEVLSLARMARRLGVTQGWLREAAEAGPVPCPRAGRRLIFNSAAVEKAVVREAAHARQEVDHGQ